MAQCHKSLRGVARAKDSDTETHLCLLCYLAAEFIYLRCAFLSHKIDVKSGLPWLRNEHWEKTLEEKPSGSANTHRQSKLLRCRQIRRLYSILAVQVKRIEEAQTCLEDHKNNHKYKQS